MAQLREGSVIKKKTGDEIIATLADTLEIREIDPSIFLTLLAGVSVRREELDFIENEDPFLLKLILDSSITEMFFCYWDESGENLTITPFNREGRGLRLFLPKDGSYGTPSGMSNDNDLLYTVSDMINNRVKTDVPEGAKFTDTITTINGKTGTITKADITALGIPAQDTVVDISGKADKTYVDSKVKTDVPENAKFTDTVVDIADNLTTDDATKALSAKQGKILDEKSPNKEFYMPHGTETNDSTGNAEGLQTTASGTASHAEGNETTASETASHAEGYGTTANGVASHAEGMFTTASGSYSHTEGMNTEASGAASHAEGMFTTASGAASHAQNEGTTAQGKAQTAIGKYNIPQGTKGSHLPNDHAFIIGNGDDDDNRSNALTVNWQGDVDIAGNFSGGIGNYTEKTQATTGTINLSLANVFTDTPSANRTYSITNAVSGQAHSFTLIINMGSTVRTLTFPASVKWQGGEIPDMSTANKTYVLTFMSVDGGATWLGMFGGEF